MPFKWIKIGRGNVFVGNFDPRPPGDQLGDVYRVITTLCAVNSISMSGMLSAGPEGVATGLVGDGGI